MVASLPPAPSASTTQSRVTLICSGAIQVVESPDAAPAAHDADDDGCGSGGDAAEALEAAPSLPAAPSESSFDDETLGEMCISSKKVVYVRRRRASPCTSPRWPAPDSSGRASVTSDARHAPPAIGACMRAWPYTAGYV